MDTRIIANKTIPEKRDWLMSKASIMPDGCIVWDKYRQCGGYGYLRVDGRHHVAHRLSWEFFVGKIPKGMHVLHRCDNRACINPKHLFLGTNLDNNIDAAKKDRRRQKLDLIKVREIRALFHSGVRQCVIARKFGVSAPQISRIVRRERRPHVS